MSDYTDKEKELLKTKCLNCKGFGNHKMDFKPDNSRVYCSVCNGTGIKVDRFEAHWATNHIQDKLNSDQYSSYDLAKLTWNAVFKAGEGE